MIAGCSQRAVVTCALAECTSRAVPALGGFKGEWFRLSKRCGGGRGPVEKNRRQ